MFNHYSTIIFLFLYTGMFEGYDRQAGAGGRSWSESKEVRS